MHTRQRWHARVGRWSMCLFGATDPPGTLVGADPATEEGAEMGLAHSNLSQKMPLCHQPPQAEEAFVHVVS